MQGFWASYRGNTVGPYPTREEAAEVFFRQFLDCGTAIVGYGNGGPWFDMRFARRSDMEVTA